MERRFLTNGLPTCPVDLGSCTYANYLRDVDGRESCCVKLLLDNLGDRKVQSVRSGPRLDVTPSCFETSKHSWEF